MNIIAKSFPNREQIQGRIDSGAFDGIELFIMEDIIEDPAKYREIVKFARDNYSVVNFETFYAVNVDGRKRTGGVIDPDSKIRDRSRALLEATVALSDLQGNVNTHFVGKPLSIDINEVNKNPYVPGEQVQEMGRYLEQFKPSVSIENVMSLETEPAGVEGVLLYNAGADMDNFMGLYRQFGIPINFDTAHLGITLEQYARNVKRNGISIIAGNPVAIRLTDHQKQLGERVLEVGLENAYMEELKRMRDLDIRNVHFSNSKLAVDSDTYKDGFTEFSREDGRLVNLDPVLYNLVHERSNVRDGSEVYQMVPEIVEGLYTEPKPDYVRVPHMVEMAEKLRAKLAD